MSNSVVELQSVDLLAALNQNLDQLFFLADRTLAKRQYLALSEGKTVPIMKLGFSDNSEMHCSLALDHSEYVGKLNFSGFRKNLAMMMLGIKERLENELPLNLMNSPTGEILFNIPGIVKGEESTNIMVCGLKQTSGSQAAIKLMYLDPAAYDEALSQAQANQDNDTEQTT